MKQKQLITTLLFLSLSILLFAFSVQTNNKNTLATQTSSSATIRFDWTPAGFHAMILANQRTIFINPYSRGDTTHYISYAKQDYAPPELEDFVESTPLDPTGKTSAEIAQIVAQGVNHSGEELRTYRLVVAATGEYTIFHGGTVQDGQAAIVLK